MRHAGHIEDIFANCEEVAGDTVADTRSPRRAAAAAAAATAAAAAAAGRRGSEGRESRGTHLASSHHILPSCAGGQAGGQFEAALVFNQGSD